ncbi:MAG: hypothetical protein JWR80_6024 [Bradyrhizobium sp.]|nr:hypothetical protein [Bradyrhizobium sp.]
MSHTYFTDREYGSAPRATEVIDERLWGGLHSLIETRLSDASFGYRFPEACSDKGRGHYGCDHMAFARMLEAEVPQMGWPPRINQLPDTPVILDLLEFCALAVGQPRQGSWHDYYDHYHLSWNRDAGLSAFVIEVNRLLARNGLAFELTAEGKIQRLLPVPLREALVQARFASGDAETDRLLEAARLRILAPKHDDRSDGLEKLWDAFERIKTLEPGNDKRLTADAMLNRAARPDSRLRHALGLEAAALTQIGNNHRIRHSEVSQEPLETPLQIDYLFTRLFAFIYLQLRASGRAA